MNRRCIAVWMSLISISLLCGPDVGAARGADVTVETIVAAWQRRHETYGSMRFVMDERVIYPRYDGTDDLVFDRVHTILIDGEKYLHERNGLTRAQIFGLGPPVTTEERHVDAFDGFDHISYSGYAEKSDTLYPLGFLYSEGDIDVTMSPPHLGSGSPIHQHFHSGGAHFRTTDPVQWKILPGAAVVDGHKCVRMEWTLYSEKYAPGYSHLWIDPERDFIVLRQIVGHGELLGGQLDIAYEFDSQSNEWIPVKWTRVGYGENLEGDAILDKSSTFTVREHQLNCKIDPSEFEFEFPTGTEVNDYRDAGRRQYITTTFGQREVTSDERMLGAKYTDLINSRSGRALLPPGQQDNLTWSWLALAGTLMILVAVWRRRRVAKA